MITYLSLIASLVVALVVLALPIVIIGFAVKGIIDCISHK